MKTKILSIAVICLLLISCKKDKSIIVTTNEYHAAIDNVTQIMVHDIFSPPVASRIFVYPNIAAYEVIAQNSKTYASLQNQLNGLDSIPKLDSKSGVNQPIAALIAHMEVTKQLVFSEELVEKFRDSLYQKWSDENEVEFEASKEYGLKVAERIKKWMGKDNYKQTRTMSKFSVYANQPGRWQPTPPAYMDAVEPHWGEIRTLVLDSASQFKPVPALSFSLEKKSPFFKEVQEVYDISKEMIKKGDNSEEIKIAQFWDCNPYVSVSQGHMMFAKKKITPGGHWMGIVQIACRKSNADFAKTVFAYTKTSIGIFEGFISCWDEKFRSNVVRPETVINQNIDENWKPLLQTPPFPEYSSGHSVVSNSSATVLTSVFGDNFAFVDDTELQFGLPKRTFTSFDAAAKEAAMSRFYGGIHYKAAIINGIGQGKNVGDFIVKKLKMIK
ncbi:vanadium-dependent haloperoxidase [Flavobacterium gawalongense]|uniref:Vanadium-dependent haloperoxidase n=1 Tax=Flavobacterium gawalongense TaxID=2594432 RepID=A0A553BX95_9FLAO|nr:vanadium-dependent haloperoxidase [Flavobacterium gawalongense]TRX04212.1 vanadium-dependent haloperoxidase [Flavobacterium gawalongense]TRX09338.1 vanadium-dependent haloperoxidase [Flavobacterium gawalongense]TRX12848.1 vanadium-dependent haloperoxidase [Flavobacterium gawalongense]TRX13193.1 vanadium-dependent haloperoxidase [Flavobacterium gawalongense]TRX30745.1 vanadium-dependent haloperoxidase [Flavobacterium gawalongense]